MKQIFCILMFLLAAVGVRAAAASVVPSDAKSLPVESVEAQPSVRVVAVGVEVMNPTDEAVEVSVIALTGQTVCHVQAPEGVTTIELRPGYYIVKTGRYSTKVVVK